MREKVLGLEGELHVKNYLEKKGYEVLDRNYRERVGEIDLIALDKETNEIVFVEVKTRSNGRFGAPEESVRRDKLRKIEKTALRWLMKHRRNDQYWRIDVIAFNLSQEHGITHIENVTL